MFTNGILEGCYWFEELIEFIKNNGEIIEIKSGIIFEKYDYIFKEYIDYFNEIKKKSEIHKFFSKLMINSLYGRMGMSDLDNYSFIVEEKNLSDYNDLNIISLKKINNMYLINVELDNKLKKKIKYIKNNIKRNISVASAITSKARIKLHKAQKEVINNEGRLLYSDTDSIFAAYKKNVDNEKHGEIFWDIKKEDTKIKKAVFISPKSYSIIYENNNEITKIKGYEQNKLNYKDIEFNFYNNNDYISLFNNKITNKKDLKLNLSNIEKKINFNIYDKRRFIDNKKKTEPLKTTDGIIYT